MIFIALGANLPSRFGSPVDTLKASIKALEENGIKVLDRSSVWLTEPVPFDKDVPYYHNAVISIETNLSAGDLLQLMLYIEADFGRVRSVKNAPRLLDLDLIAYNDEIIKDGDRLIVPHQRMHERSFVLRPLGEIANNWNHIVLGQSVAELIHYLPDEQNAKILEDVSL